MELKMTEDLETKAKPSYKYRIEDFYAFVGVNGYIHRNRNSGLQPAELHKYERRKMGLILFNVALFSHLIAPLANYLSDLTLK